VDSPYNATEKLEARVVVPLKPIVPEVKPKPIVEPAAPAGKPPVAPGGEPAPDAAPAPLKPEEASAPPAPVDKDSAAPAPAEKDPNAAPPAEKDPAAAPAEPDSPLPNDKENAPNGVADKDTPELFCPIGMLDVMKRGLDARG
jgi:hypothetical protein